jgi:hypothetical protein
MKNLLNDDLDLTPLRGGENTVSDAGGIKAILADFRRQKLVSAGKRVNTSIYQEL